MPKAKRFKLFLPPEQAAAKKAKWKGAPVVRPQTDAERTALALAATAKVVPPGASSFSSGEMAPRSPLDESHSQRTKRLTHNEGEKSA